MKRIILFLLICISSGIAIAQPNAHPLCVYNTQGRGMSNQYTPEWLYIDSLLHNGGLPVTGGGSGGGSATSANQVTQIAQNESGGTAYNNLVNIDADIQAGNTQLGGINNATAQIQFDIDKNLSLTYSLAQELDSIRSSDDSSAKYAALSYAKLVKFDTSTFSLINNNLVAIQTKVNPGTWMIQTLSVAGTYTVSATNYIVSGYSNGIIPAKLTIADITGLIDIEKAYILGILTSQNTRSAVPGTMTSSHTVTCNNASGCKLFILQ